MRLHGDSEGGRAARLEGEQNSSVAGAHPAGAGPKPLRLRRWHRIASRSISESVPWPPPFRGAPAPSPHGNPHHRSGLL